MITEAKFNEYLQTTKDIEKREQDDRATLYRLKQKYE